MYYCHVLPSGHNPPMPSNQPTNAADAHMATPDMPDIRGIGRAGEASGTIVFTWIGSIGNMLCVIVLVSSSRCCSC